MTRTMVTEGIPGHPGATPPERKQGSRHLWASPRNGPAHALRRALILVRTEGVGGLIRGIGRYLNASCRLMYAQEHIRVYHLDIANALMVEAKAPCDGISLHVVEQRDDALKLVQQGYENVLDIVPATEERLQAGLVAACAFVGSELASMDWMAFSERGKAMVDPAPYFVAFGKGEACTAGAFTVRRFRRRGIAAYRFSLQVAYLHRRGCTVCHNSIAVGNVPSQRCVERYGAVFDTVLCRQRVLGRVTYREVSLPASTGHHTECA